jgi:hypothetical protein
LIMVKTKTAAKVPIMEAGAFGENDKHVNTDIIKK